MKLIDCIKGNGIENVEEFMIIIKDGKNNSQFIRENIIDVESIGMLEISKKNILDRIVSKPKEK